MFEKDAKLCLKTDQLFILQDYLQQIQPNSSSAVSSLTTGAPNNESDAQKYHRRRASSFNPSTNNEFLMLYKSNQLHLIQDFLFKITNIKVKRLKQKIS